MGLSSVFILILNYNSWRDTVECLESVQRLTYPNYRIVVIDNSSTDGSMEKIKAWAAGELPVDSKFFVSQAGVLDLVRPGHCRSWRPAGSRVEEEIEALLPNRRMVLIQTEG